MSSYIQSRNNAIQTQRIKLQQVRNRLADAQSSRASAGDIAFWQSEVIIAERVLARLERRR